MADGENDGFREHTGANLVNHPAILLIAGILIIIKGGDLFVSAAVRMAKLLRLPTVVVGSTLVSLATTTPELVVSVMAGLRGEPGLAVGNAVGSCICNIGLILGTTALLKNVEISIAALRIPLLAMSGAGLLLVVMTLDLKLARWQGAILVLLGVAYFTWDFWRHWNLRSRGEVAEATAIQQGVVSARWPWVETRYGTLAQFILGAFVVVIGSRLLVDGAVTLSARMGIPPIIIGFTVVAIGTSLPELVTAVSSTRRSVSDLAVGNVLGANIANLTLIIGTAALINAVSLDRITQLFNFPVLLLFTGVVWWRLQTHQKLTRREGIALLSLYALFLVIQVAVARHP